MRIDSVLVWRPFLIDGVVSVFYLSLFDCLNCADTWDQIYEITLPPPHRYAPTTNPCHATTQLQTLRRE